MRKKNNKLLITYQQLIVVQEFLNLFTLLDPLVSESLKNIHNRYVSFCKNIRHFQESQILSKRKLSQLLKNEPSLQSIETKHTREGLYFLGLGLKTEPINIRPNDSPLMIAEKATLNKQNNYSPKSNNGSNPQNESHPDHPNPIKQKVLQSANS